MWILPLVGYLGLVIGFIFLTLAIGEPIPSVLCTYTDTVE